ncbi:TVP38/TMEM64 family protein [Candidatus Dependentiae bacterium]
MKKSIKKSAKGKSYTYKIIIACLLIFLVLLLRYTGIINYVSLETVKANKAYLVDLVAKQYVWFVFVYLALFIGASFLSIPITVILSIMAGFFFGVFTGALYVNIGTVLGSTLSFITFRYLLGGFVKEKYKDKLADFNAHIKKHGYSYLLSLQLFPATPSFLINTLSGLTQISLWTFIWTTSIGIIPGSLVYTFSGQELAKIESTRDLLSWPILVIFVLLALISLLPIFLNRFFNKKYKI